MIIQGKTLLKLAIEIEKIGEEFYTQLKKLFPKDSKEYKLFEKLIDVERKHRKIFEKTFRDLKVEQLQNIKVNKEELLHIRELVEGKIFDDIKSAKIFIEKDPGVLHLINYAIGFEIDSLYFYQQIEPFILPVEKEVIKTVIREEKKHIKMLMNYRIELKFKNHNQKR